ncbi:MAG TPA: MipA/OmpV family protein, partial [Telluria sp.]|nr:MipA/OmpV family protein [Telluria sp.]
GIHKRGWVAEPRLLWEVKGPDERWNFDLHAAAAMGDRAINRYFYEVAPAYATSARPEFAARAGLIEWRLGASGSWRIGRDLRLYAYTRYENFAAAANAASPLHLRGHGFAGGVGVSWVLARSSERAPN